MSANKNYGLCISRRSVRNCNFGGIYILGWEEFHSCGEWRLETVSTRTINISRPLHNTIALPDIIFRLPTGDGRIVLTVYNEMSPPLIRQIQHPHDREPRRVHRVGSGAGGDKAKFARCYAKCVCMLFEFAFVAIH